jgi:bifunctional non-homologous end joining protein LigD
VVALDAGRSAGLRGPAGGDLGRKTGDLVFFVFDLLFRRRGPARLPLSERKDAAEALMGRTRRQPSLVDHFVTAGDAVLLSACRMELEGIVSKRLDAPYRRAAARPGPSPSAGPAMRW